MRILFLAALLLLLIAPPLCAQDDTPSGFFEKDFVTGPRPEQSERPEQSVRRPVETAVPLSGRGAEQDDGTESEDEGGFISESSAREEQPPKKSEEQGPERTGTKVKSMSLILSPDDPKHFAKYYKQALEAGRRCKVPLRDVFVIGDSSALLDSRDLEIFSEDDGGDFRYMPFLPPVFKQVQTSPTLVLHTAEGVILLEGFSNFSRRFNSKGEFLEPEPYELSSS